MFKWISSIQNAIKDARVNRKGPGRRRQDKLKSGSPGRDTVDTSAKHKTAPVDGLDFNTGRVEPISILHCEQKNRPRGPKGRRLPGRNGFHSTILNGTSSSDLLDHHSSRVGGEVSDNLYAINESISLESSTEMTSESSINHHISPYQRRSRTTTNDTLDTDVGTDDLDEPEEKKEDEDVEDSGDHLYDALTEEPTRRIIGIMNKMRMEEDEKETRKEKNLKLLNGLNKGDNHSPESSFISKSNGDSNHHNLTRLTNGKANGYSPITAAIKSTTSTSPSPIKRFNENQDTKDLKRQLNAIFSNNNQHHPHHHHHHHHQQQQHQQQLTINLGESTVNIDQNKLTSCLKDIYPTLVTSSTLLDSSSSLSSSLTNINPQLKSLIKEIESLKDVKKSKALNKKIQEVIGKLIALADDYSKSIESFDQYNDQIVKLVSSLSSLVSQSTATSSPSSPSPPSSPRLVKPNKLPNGNKTVNSPSSTHC